MKYLVSYLIRIKINLLRVFDHIYRELTGKPVLARCQITPELYLGGQYGESGLKQLSKYEITAIVNMRKEPIPHWVGEQKFKTLHLPTNDNTPPSIAGFKKGIMFIDNEIESGGKVYVHCRWGEGRGPSMVIAHLMSTGLLFEDAHELVKDVRAYVALSKSQVIQLRRLEKILNKSTNQIKT